MADGSHRRTAVKRDGVVGHPVDVERVRRLVARPERVLTGARRGPPRGPPCGGPAHAALARAHPHCRRRARGLLHDGRPPRAGDRPGGGRSPAGGISGHRGRGNEDCAPSSAMCGSAASSCSSATPPRASPATSRRGAARGLTADAQALARRCRGRATPRGHRRGGGRACASPPARAMRPRPPPGLGDSGTWPRPSWTRGAWGAATRGRHQLDLAPVVDVAVNPAIRGGRAGPTYSRDPAEVTAQRAAFVRGMHRSGGAHRPQALPRARHPAAPGSIKASPTSRTPPTSTWSSPRIAPHRGGSPTASCPDTCSNRRLDAWHPASLSWYTVRRSCGPSSLQGMVVSDDLSWAPSPSTTAWRTRALLALDAGVDILLIADNNARRDRGGSAGSGAVRRGLAEDDSAAARWRRPSDGSRRCEPGRALSSLRR